MQVGGVFSFTLNFIVSKGASFGGGLKLLLRTAMRVFFNDVLH